MACSDSRIHESEHSSDDDIPLSGEDLSRSSSLVPWSHTGANIPLFIDPHYNPRNVNRREDRKASKIMSIQKQLTEKNRYIQVLEKKIVKLEKSLALLQSKLDLVREELTSTASEVCVTTRKLEKVEKQAATTKRKLIKMGKTCDATQNDLMKTEIEKERIEEENAEMMATLTSLEDEATCSSVTDSIDFTFQTKSGKQYSHKIRNLYYTLLADQVPPAKIAPIIRSVLTCFVPDVDASTLKLPASRCAGYMRREELKTVSMTHKASVLCEDIQAGRKLHVNADGTTKNQRKLNGIAFNGIVLSVNEVHDGTAETIIQDLEKELEKLRFAAVQLNLPNADGINWTLFTSSTSDSAATQKKFNRLLQERKDDDEARYGANSGQGLEIIENFCAMHLGVNLRKAFLSVEELIDSPVDAFVYEFAKLFGTQGVKEYGVGVLQFPDFLETCQLSEDCEDMVSYYKKCSEIRLSRQVGNRYFVSASNAGRILFLLPAAIKYLEFTGKSTGGNKLEKTVYGKLQDSKLVSALKADALMYYHVYADLVSLAKSTELDKSAFDMSKHYLELKCFLDELEAYPEIAGDSCLQVFVSEETLYGPSEKTNHRNHRVCKIVQERLFKRGDLDALVLPVLASGAHAMRNKLLAYAQSQLPGGKYWNPDPYTEAVLRQLKPNNDLCESMLGLNDYLVTAIPNLQQLTRSNLIEVKKNKTMKWYAGLSEDKQEHIARLAVRERTNVAKQYKDEQAKLAENRRERILKDKRERDMKEKKAAAEREKLSKVHLISSVCELEQTLSNIDEEPITAQAKAAKKRKIIKEQVNLRKKYLQQNVHIPLSHRGKQRSLLVLVDELREVISASTTSSIDTITPEVPDPYCLVGRRIMHRFVCDGEMNWFYGNVLSYNCSSSVHEVLYDGEDEACFFDLMEDLKSGDLQLMID